MIEKTYGGDDMDRQSIREDIRGGKITLGIEFGSTRIKAIIIDDEKKEIASGEYEWENQLIEGVWTYELSDVWKGLQKCYADLKNNIKQKYDVIPTIFRAIGFSGMMHGYLPFDKNGNQLVPFRTWRNTMTGEASEKLSKLFDFHIPQRWSIAHLYQAILKGEEHVKDISFMTTLAGYVHWQLTGQKVIGIGDASGMFPVDSMEKDYDNAMIKKFDNLAKQMGYTWNLKEILPKIALAGEQAGCLSERGAKMLDTEGDLKAGILCCPPEGDAGTGMVATNSVAAGTGNISAGTSIFAMIVLEKNLSKYYEELDLVTTPDGVPVAMVHCNNGTTDLNAWVNLFKEVLETFGTKVDTNVLYTTLYQKALQGEDDCGGLLAYNYDSGEHITGFDEGRPIFTRLPNETLSLANFMRVNLYTTLGTLKVGMNILTEKEHVQLKRIQGHGGMFKTKNVMQSIVAAAIKTPVYVMETAGEGGAWGIALLASYMQEKKDGQSLADYLKQNVFSSKVEQFLKPTERDVMGFDKFFERYQKGLCIERTAVECLKK